jgi:hypothetical protein
MATIIAGAAIMSFCSVSASNVPPNLLILFRETSGLLTGSLLVLWISPSYVNRLFLWEGL